MKKSLLWIIAYTLLILQIFFTTIPLIIMGIVLLYIFSKKTSWIFFVGFVSGILLDVYSFHRLGTSSLYLVTFIFILSLYEKKFEIETMPFVALSSLFGSIGYMLLFAQAYSFLQIFLLILGSCIGFVLFRDKGVSGDLK